jgi:pyridoxine 5-phosphate synthase
MAKLGVNVDHVATLRQARGGRAPSPLAAAALAEMGGADHIVVHLREDRRHIQDRDVRLLRDAIQTALDFEMAATSEMLQIALEIKPDAVTLVPERRQELTTEGGLNVAARQDELGKAIALLHDGGVRVSLFIDPDVAQIKGAHRISADAIEIHTGPYVHAQGKNREVELHHIQEAARLAKKLGMGVHAGHGLDYQNVAAVAAIPEIETFNIGHSIVARAVLVGMAQAVRDMKAQLR